MEGAVKFWDLALGAPPGIIFFSLLWLLMKISTLRILGVSSFLEAEHEVQELDLVDFDVEVHSDFFSQHKLDGKQLNNWPSVVFLPNHRNYWIWYQ